MTHTLTDRQIEILSHALGAEKFYQCKGFYRNYFAAGGDDVREWEELIELGMAFCSARDKYPVYHVNDRGQNIVREWLREKKAREPKLTRSKKRYKVWLDICETMDETYGEWLRNPAWNEYRKERGV